MSVKIKTEYEAASNSKISSRVWLVWLCGALFYFYQFVLRISPSVMTDDLMQSFSVQACALGVLSAFYYNAYASMQIPVGMLIDRFGPRRLVVMAVTMCVMGAAVFASSTTIQSAAAGRFLMGMGSAFAYVGTLKIATLWFPREYVGRVIGFTMVFGTLGGVTGGAPLGYLIDYVGWRQSMILMALMGLGLAFASWILVRDRPSQLGIEENKSTAYQSTNLMDGLIKVILSKQVWLIGVYAGLMYVPLAAFADLWGVPYICEAYHVDRKVAASVTSMILVGAAIGSPLTAWFSDKLRTRKLFMTTGAVVSCVLFTLMIYIPNIPLAFMYVILFLAGIAFTGQVLSFAAVTEGIPLSASGVAIGFTNMIVMLSGVIFEPLIGWLLEFHWEMQGGGLLNGLPVYTVENFRFALMTIPASLVVGVLLTRFIKESYPQK